MEEKEDEYLLISGIQHYEFCPRQWALIHIEQQWEENQKTIQGQEVHKKVDQPEIKEKRKGFITSRAMPVHSHQLQVTGVCDVVEFSLDNQGVELNNYEGKYKVSPVEYKRGSPKTNEVDILQLVAQAICLEEMLVCSIEEGYIYYNETKHRIKIEISQELRSRVKKIVEKMHAFSLMVRK